MILTEGCYCQALCAGVVLHWGDCALKRCKCRGKVTCYHLFVVFTVKRLPYQGQISQQDRLRHSAGNIWGRFIHSHFYRLFADLSKIGLQANLLLQNILFCTKVLKSWIERLVRIGFLFLFLGPDCPGWTVVSGHGQFAGRMDNVNDSCFSSNVVPTAGFMWCK